jgi:outer membrane protein assembly factor BamB
MCSAAIATLAACDLSSRELGSKRERWTIFEPAGSDSAYDTLLAAPDDGVLVVASHWYGFHGDSELRSYAADGSLRWATPLAASISVARGSASMDIAVDGTIIAAAKTSDPADAKAGRGTLLGFDPGGALRWSLDVEGTTELSAVVALSDGRVAYGGDAEGAIGAQIGILSASGVAGPTTQIREDSLFDATSPVQALVERPTGELVALLMHERPNKSQVISFDADLTPVWSHEGRVPEFSAGIVLAADGSLLLLTHSVDHHHNADESEHWVVSDNRITVLDVEGNVERELEGLEPDLEARLIALEPDGTIVLGGSDTRRYPDVFLGLAEIDPDSGETLWSDRAGVLSDLLWAENGLSALVVTTSGDLVASAMYDDRGDTTWRGWLRRYAARPSEQP